MIFTAVHADSQVTIINEILIDGIPDADMLEFSLRDSDLLIIICLDVNSRVRMPYIGRISKFFCHLIPHIFMVLVLTSQ